MSLRLKISLLSALISGAMLLGFGCAGWLHLYQERLRSVDREIRTLAARHPGWWANRANYGRLTSMLEFTFGEQRKDQVILVILDRIGTKLYASPHWPADLDLGSLGITIQSSPSTARDVQSDSPSTRWHPGPPWQGGLGRGFGPGVGDADGFIKPPKFVTVAAGEKQWRLGILEGAQTTVLLGLDFAEVEREMRRLRNGFLLAFPVALLLVGLGGWLVGHRALEPLKTIAETAERVTARGLDQRIRLGRTEGEVARLVHVLNGMMDRLEKSFQQATRFSADASHELKTPLAIMQGELENALQAAPAGSDEQQMFNRLLEETQQLKRIMRTLLLLAQADAGRLLLAREDTNLSDLLASAIDDGRVLAAELALTWDIQIEPKLHVAGDPILLATAFYNLLTNAIKYNQRQGRVVVRSSAEQTFIIVSVANTGPGIATADRPKVFDRFFRGTQVSGHAPEGTGLGLSLAREIIRAHGGEVSLEASQAGWTTFQVRLNKTNANL